MNWQKQKEKTIEQDKKKKQRTKLQNGGRVVMQSLHSSSSTPFLHLIILTISYYVRNRG